MKLNELADRPGAARPRLRRGRGIGSGKGGTAGRGHKGQKSRSGVALKGFEGGQMPLYRRLPKHGFVNVFRKRYAVVDVGRLGRAAAEGKLDPSAPIDAAALKAAGVITHIRDGVRLVGRGELTAALTVAAAGASRSAAAAVEKAGGRVVAAAGAKPKPKDERDDKPRGAPPGAAHG